METQLATDPNRFTQDLFDGLPRRYDRLAEVLSFGQNGRWRRAMVDRVLTAAPRRVLDVATGTAGVALQLADRTRADITGVDLTPAMLRAGRAVCGPRAMDTRITLLAGNAEVLPFPDNSFDALTFTYLLRYVHDPAATVRELVARPQARRTHGQPRLRGSGQCRLAVVVVVLHARCSSRSEGCSAAPSGCASADSSARTSAGSTQRHPVSTIVDAWENVGMVDVGARAMSLGGGLVMWGTKSNGVTP